MLYERNKRNDRIITNKINGYQYVGYMEIIQKYNRTTI